jgi:DNA-binding beta-propeller fold protein YncE
MINMTNQVSSQDQAGRRFTAKLAANMTASGVVVAPAGTTVYGKVTKSSQAGRLVGKSELELNLTEINIGGKMFPLMTTNFAEAGKSSFRKTARNAGMGALIGGAFGDSDDAKKGAAIGLGVSVLRKGNSVVVPAGAMLEFRMTQPLTIKL